jgi:hypothetical protein
MCRSSVGESRAPVSRLESVGEKRKVPLHMRSVYEVSNEPKGPEVDLDVFLHSEYPDYAIVHVRRGQWRWSTGSLIDQ